MRYPLVHGADLLIGVESSYYHSYVSYLMMIGGQKFEPGSVRLTRGPWPILAQASFPQKHGTLARTLLVRTNQILFSSHGLALESWRQDAQELHHTSHLSHESDFSYNKFGNNSCAETEILKLANAQRRAFLQATLSQTFSNGV